MAERAAAVDGVRDLILAGMSFRQAVAKHYAVGVRETDAISALYMHGSLSVGELGRMLRLAPGVVTNLLGRLERAGLARRVADPDDLRRVMIHLTERSYEVVTETRGWLSLSLDALVDPDDAAAMFAAVAHQLRAICDSLHDGNVPRPPGRRDQREPGDAAALQQALGRGALVLRIRRALADVSDEESIAATLALQLRDYTGATFVGIARLDAVGRTMRYVSLDPLPARAQWRWASVAVDDSLPAGATALHARSYFHASTVAGGS